MLSESQLGVNSEYEGNNSYFAILLVYSVTEAS